MAWLVLVCAAIGFSAALLRGRKWRVGVAVFLPCIWYLEREHTSVVGWASMKDLETGDTEPV